MTWYTGLELSTQSDDDDDGDDVAIAADAISLLFEN